MIAEMQVKYETDAVMKDNQLLTTQSALSQSKVRQQKNNYLFLHFWTFFSFESCSTCWSGKTTRGKRRTLSWPRKILLSLNRKRRSQTVFNMQAGYSMHCCLREII